MTDTTALEDRAALNRLAEEARHWRDVQDLRDQLRELRERNRQ